MRLHQRLVRQELPDPGPKWKAAPISPIALEAVKRIAVFDIERDINGLSAEKRLAARRGRSGPRTGRLLQGASTVGLEKQQFGSEKQDAVRKKR
jgi:hypothetical protein